MDLNDGSSFISSFYKQANYVPDLYIYDKILSECIKVNNDRTLLKYLGQGQKFMNLIDRNGRETRLIMNNGDNVFIRITEITGRFLHYAKEKIQLPNSSIEYPVYDIKEIVDISIPLDITGYKKPSRKFIKEMFE